MSDAQIFQVFSLLYLAIGVGMMVNMDYYKKVFNEFAENAGMMYFGGAVSLTVGYLILALKGCCAGGFSVIISIIGWLALIKGILIFVRPEMMMNITKAMLKEKTLKLMVGVTLLLGLVFSFLGFCPKSPL